MKKYENLIEMAFRYVEEIQNPVSPDEADKAYANLKAAVEALKDFRAAGEPIFVLRGHDRMAPRAIRGWGYFVADAKGIQSEYEQAVLKSDRMSAWQEAQPTLVKMPD